MRARAIEVARASPRSSAGRGSACGSAARRRSARGTCRAAACGCARAARARRRASDGSPRRDFAGEPVDADDVAEVDVDLARALDGAEQLDPPGAVDEVEEDELPHVAPRHARGRRAGASSRASRPARAAPPRRGRRRSRRGRESAWARLMARESSGRPSSGSPHDRPADEVPAPSVARRAPHAATSCARSTRAVRSSRERPRARRAEVMPPGAMPPSVAQRSRRMPLARSAPSSAQDPRRDAVASTCERRAARCSVPMQSCAAAPSGFAQRRARSDVLRRAA